MRTQVGIIGAGPAGLVLVHLPRLRGIESGVGERMRHLWRAEHFSWWMTSMLRHFHDESPFHHRLQRSQLQYVTSSRPAATMLAENYVGLSFDKDWT